MKKAKKFFCMLFALVLVIGGSINVNATDAIEGYDTGKDLTVGYNPYEFESSPESNRSIIGSDDRITVTNTSSFPYTAIAYLTVTYSCGCPGAGNGFMVSKNCMLTAGHCIVCVDHGKEATSITATFGMQSNTNYLVRVTATPSNAVIYHDPQFTGTQKNYDYGYVVFETNVGNTTGWFGLASRNDSTLDGMSVTVTGYEKTSLKRCSGEITSVATNRIKYDADTLEGQSGAPVYFNDATYGNLVVAIHTHGTDLLNWKNSGWRITSTFINELRSLGYLS